MAVTVGDIMQYMEEYAPVSLAESWDNPGLLIGDASREVKRALVALDTTQEVVREAVHLKADMIINHHPLLFQPVKQITAQTAQGRRIMELIENRISVYAAHTNLDIVFGGTNDTLAVMLGLEEISLLESTDTPGHGIGRIGALREQMSLKDFSLRVKSLLQLPSIRAVGDLERSVRMVALCTGSGFEFMDTAVKQGADVYVTADFRFHEAQKAQDAGIGLIDATHYASEAIIVPKIKEYLDQQLKKNQQTVEILCSQVNGQPFQQL